MSWIIIMTLAYSPIIYKINSRITSTCHPPNNGSLVEQGI